MSTHTLTSGQLTATLCAHGAELHSLKNPRGEEFIWQADPQVWARHAPLLFPIVGRLKQDQLIHHTHRYPLTQHGFARDMEFEWLTQERDHCLLQLQESETSLQCYPFPFQLQVAYQLQNNQLDIEYRLHNTGSSPLPASLGAHPAFVWPLPGVESKADHLIEFAEEEPSPIRRLENGLLIAHGFDSPVQGRTLPLNEALFEADAIIFDQHQSRCLTYHAPGSAKVIVEFADFPHLGIWTKPGANFICLEPWQGHSSPIDFAGEFSDKPGIVTLQAGETRCWQHSITIES